MAKQQHKPGMAFGEAHGPQHTAAQISAFFSRLEAASASCGGGETASGFSARQGIPQQFQAIGRASRLDEG